MLVVAAAASLGSPPCVTTPLQPNHEYQQICDDFCNDKCSFYNASLGETGQPFNKTVWRWTPRNTTGIKNKDTGDAPGDISFFLSKKNLTQYCAKDPTGWGCFLDGDNLYGEFVVEMDGKFGPYFECNPINVFENPHDPYHSRHWSDTREFECGQGCMQPTHDDCHLDPRRARNGTYGYGGAMMCTCDSTARHNKTVGREFPPYAGGRTLGPKYWPPQCNLAYYEQYDKAHGYTP